MHNRDECADDLVGGDSGLGDALADAALYFGSAQNLIGGLIGTGAAISGSGGGLGAIASIFDVFIYNPLLTVGELGLASSWVNSSFRHTVTNLLCKLNVREI